MVTKIFFMWVRIWNRGQRLQPWAYSVAKLAQQETEDEMRIQDQHQLSMQGFQNVTVRDVIEQLQNRFKVLNPESNEITVVRDILLHFVADFPITNQQSIMDQWKGIPPEIFRHIFSFVPLASYRAFALVCKSWKNALDPIWKPLVLREAEKVGFKYSSEPKSWHNEYRNHVITFSNVYPTHFNWDPQTASFMMPLEGAETHIWLGPVPAEFILQCEVSFPEHQGEVGRHGGVSFSTTNRVTRWDLRKGWNIDWIDRPSDHGYRVGIDRVDICDGAWKHEPHPGRVWRFTQTKKQLLFEADGKHVYKTNRVCGKPGFLAFWNYGSSSCMQIKNLVCWKL